MEIKTKFAFGDKVWVIHCAAPAIMVINSIHVYKTSVGYYGKIYIGEYHVYTEVSYSECECFASKEELIKHITEDGNESM